MKRTTKILSACLLLGSVTAHATPITFEFSTGNVTGFGFSPYGSENLPVPAPFDAVDSTLATSLSGTFTIESDVVGRPGYMNLNGVMTETMSLYSNPVTAMTLNVGGHQLTFQPTVAPGSLTPNESLAYVVDLPTPSNNPYTNYDAYSLSASLGTGGFDDPYAALRADFSLYFSPDDLGVITNRDLVQNLVFSPGWSASFSLYDATTQRSFQLNAPVTSLARIEATAVPEPGSWLLMATALGGLALASRRRALRS
jgi:hypothetical protein